MKKSIKVAPKKRRGRPATGKDPHIAARMPEELVSQVEKWAAENSATRSEAIRRLVEIGLTVGAKPKQAPAKRAERAKELAAKTIEKIIDPTVPPEERAQRRRQLIKGPSELREDRRGVPESKEK